MRQYETRITRLTVLPKGEPIFSEMATTIEIADEAAGEFVKVTSQTDNVDNHESVLISPEEWPLVRDAIDKLIADCLTH
jgi:hypothetical protein